MANISIRMMILLAAAGLSLAGAADAAFADTQPGFSDGYGYDKNGAFNDGNGYDKNGVFNDGNGYDKNGVYDDGMGYTDSNGSTNGYGSSSGFNCDDNDADNAYGNANCGWHDGYFYPGFGTVLFDRHHHQHEMTSRQHDYFTRQARGPVGRRSVGLGSGMFRGSGGVRHP